MRSRTHTFSYRHWILLSVFVGTILMLALQGMTRVLGSDNDPASHVAASTLVVCHSMPRGDTGTETYFCSTRGCYSDETYEQRVVGTYPDIETCRGMADSFQD